MGYHRIVWDTLHVCMTPLIHPLLQLAKWGYVTYVQVGVMWRLPVTFFQDTIII